MYGEYKKLDNSSNFLINLYYTTCIRMYIYTGIAYRQPSVAATAVVVTESRETTDVCEGVTATATIYAIRHFEGFDDQL